VLEFDVCDIKLSSFWKALGAEMVAIHRKAGSHLHRNRVAAAAACFLFSVLALSLFEPNYESQQLVALLGTEIFRDNKTLDQNAQEMRFWRIQLRLACQSFIDNSIHGNNNITKSHQQRHIPDLSTLSPTFDRHAASGRQEREILKFAIECFVAIKRQDDRDRREQVLVP
jgi:hypothetical protein